MSDFRVELNGVTGTKQILKDLAKETGTSVKFLCQDQLRLWVIDAIKKIGNDPSLALGEQKRKQMERIDEDANRIFEGVPNDAFASALIIPELADKVITSLPGMNTWHKKHRTGKGGVAAANDGRRLVKVSLLRKFIKQQQKRIGIAKAGFVDSLEALRRATAGGKGGVPQWIYKVASEAPGSTTSLSTMSKEGKGYVKAQNNVRYINSLFDAGRYKALARTRQKDMNENMIKRKKRIENQYQRLLDGI